MTISARAQDLVARIWRTPYVLLPLPPLFWALNLLIGRAYAGLLPPVALTFWRWVVASLCLLPFMGTSLWTRRRDLPRHFPLIAVAGIAGFAGYPLLNYIALQTTPAATAAMLNSTLPLMTPLVAWLLLGERPSTRLLLGVMISLTGVLWIVTRGNWPALRSLSIGSGELLVLAAVACFALYSVLLRRRPATLSPGLFLSAMVLVTTAALVPGWGLEHQAGRDVPLAPWAIGAVLFVGIFPSLVATILWNRCVATLGASVTGISFHLVAAYSALLAAIFLGEPVHGYHLMGIVLILAGVGAALWPISPQTFSSYTYFICVADFCGLRNANCSWQSSTMQTSRTSEVHARLPPGQRAMADFPRFGGVAFSKRPLKSKEIRLEISGPLERSIVLTAIELATLPRVTLTADFHCAAGWSHRAPKWSGFRFRDVWDTLIVPNVQRAGEHRFVVLRCQDGYRTALPLADLLAPDVLIADRLNDQPLTLEHGAPIRIVAPAHYGYKSAKHLDRIELRKDDVGYRPLLPRLMDHPRARVALEERGQFLPGWLLRYLFRPFIGPIIRKLKLAAADDGTNR